MGSRFRLLIVLLGAMLAALAPAACRLTPPTAAVSPPVASPGTTPLLAVATASAPAVNTEATGHPSQAPGATQSATAEATLAPPTTAATNGGPVANGCPGQSVPAEAGKVDVVVGQKIGGGGSVTLAPGQVLEVRLGAQVRWRLNLEDPDHVLEQTAQNGWYDTLGPACVWRFTAKLPGTVTLAYSGRPVCLAGSKCTQFVAETEFVVTVTG